MELRLEVAEWLTEWASSDRGRKLLAELPPKRNSAAAILRLRKLGLNSDQASAAAELLELRQRARVKFECAEELFFTRRAYEQSSGQKIARWKLLGIHARFADQPLVILDLCCGVGGDLLQFSQHYPCFGIDRDPALVHFARTNLQQVRGDSGTSVAVPPSLVVTADVESLLPKGSQPIDAQPASSGSLNKGLSQNPLNPGPSTPPEDQGIQMESKTMLSDWLPYLPPEASDWAVKHQLMQHQVVWHLDPDRRDSTGRHTSLADLSPSEGFIHELATRSGVGMLKLAPSTELNQTWRTKAHWQWIGTDRECKQLLGWFGFDATWPPAQTSVAVANRDTNDWVSWRLPIEHEEHIAAQAEPLCFLFEPHSVFYAARRTSAFALQNKWVELTGSGYFTAEQPLAAENELCSGFRVLEVLPLRAEKIREWLVQNQFVLAEIKSRTVPEKDWKPLLDLMRQADSPVSYKRAVALLFRGPKGNGQAIRVALCERSSGSGKQ